MSEGSDGVRVLVVASSRSLARDLAAGIEAERDGVSAVTAAGLEGAVDRLERSEIDGVVVSTEGFGSDCLQVVGTIESSADGPVLVEVSGGDIARRAAIAAGAADAVEDLGGDEDLAVLANRLELAIRAARAEQTATETQQRYHRLLEASPAAIVIYDEERAIQYANPAAAELVGADDPYEVVGRDLLEFVVADSLSTARERFERIVEDREPVEPRELGLEGLDGERRYVESAASPVTIEGEPGGQAVLTDVTELKERERRLRTERDRFTALFESLPEPAVHVAYEEGAPIVRNVNTAFVEGFGYDADAVAGESLDEFVVPEGHEDEATELDRITTEGGQVEREVERATADGTREFLFRAQSVETASGDDECVCIYVDVTERIRREQALERQNERLDAFASIVSHDLKSPLSVARGNLNLAQEGPDRQSVTENDDRYTGGEDGRHAPGEEDGSQASGEADGSHTPAGSDGAQRVARESDHGYLAKVEKALNRMEQIIDDLLRLARRGEHGIEPEPVEGVVVVAEAWTEVTVDGGELDNEWDRRILADRSQLRELLSNLLRNAVQHGGEDVTIEVGPIEPDPSSEAGPGPRESNDRYGFYVADDGPGIPPGDRDAIFDPGYTTTGQGTGFGLVVVDEIAGAHGWSVSVTDSDAGGARFEFTGVEPADDR